MKDKMKKIADFVRQKCSADDFTLRIFHNHDLYSRFAQNGITQHIDGKNLQIKLDVAFDNKTGSALVNQNNEENLVYLIKTAEEMAKVNKPDPEFMASETDHELRKLEEPATATKKLTVQQMVDGIEKCVENARFKKAKISGLSHKHISQNYMITKNGFCGYDEHGIFSHSMTMKKGGRETKVERSCKDFAQFSMKENLQQLNQQFDSLQEPQQIKNERMPVIMRPQAFLTWIYYLIWTYRRREADEGMNPYTNKIGKKFFGEKFSLRSVIDNPVLQTPRFDHDGLPTKHIDWIEKGVIKNMQADRYYAKKQNIEPASIFNIAIDGGQTSEEEMMQKAGRGIILNSLWYIRPVDMKAGEWTGLTRDGVLYFEDGKIKKAVTNFRWNEILHNATKRILALGPAQQIEYIAQIPTVLIDDFNFVDVTTF
jgi:predicted Zn-dependent protease